MSDLIPGNICVCARLIGVPMAVGPDRLFKLIPHQNMTRCRQVMQFMKILTCWSEHRIILQAMFEMLRKDWFLSAV
jgi:hypothetical protein